MKKGTLTDAINLVSTISIVEEFNVPHFTKKGITYLLCPGHEDRHFGSCYIDKNDNGYYCYACGEHVDKWHMVLKLNGNDKSKAATWFFDTAGIDRTKTIEEDPYQNLLKLIKQIEPYFKNGTIYNDLHECSKVESSYGRNIGGAYLYSEISITNPLLETYKKDKVAFKKIVLNMLMQTLKKVKQVKSQYGTKNLYIDGFETASQGELAKACDEKCSAIETIMRHVEVL